MRSGEERGGGRGKGRGKALLRWAGAEKGFSGESDEKRRAEGVELVETSEYGKILIEVLTEAEAGVERDLIECDAGRGGVIADGGETGEYCGERVGEIGEAVHRREFAAVMHKDRAAAGSSEERRHGGVAEAGNVINYVGAEVEGRGCG